MRLHEGLILGCVLAAAAAPAWPQQVPPAATQPLQAQAALTPPAQLQAELAQAQQNLQLHRAMLAEAQQLAAAKAAADASTLTGEQGLQALVAAQVERSAALERQQQDETAALEEQQAAMQAAQSDAQAKHQGAADQQAVYQAALRDADAARWNAALAKLDQLDAAGGPNQDAALYWKAYVQSKLAMDQQALESLAELEQRYPASSWKTDAQALDLQLRQANGQKVSPGAQPNDDLKLLAINGLMQTDPKEALPLLEKVVQGNASPQVKRRALFVMAQSGSGEGQAELLRIAQSPADPALQLQAIRYLGMMGAKNQPALAQVYASASSPDVKRAVLEAYMMDGDRTDLLAAAKNGGDPALQEEAIRYLAMSGGKDELWQLYQGQLPTAARSDIIRSLAMSGDTVHLITLAQTEKNPQLQLEVVRALGMTSWGRAPRPPHLPRAPRAGGVIAPAAPLPPVPPLAPGAAAEGARPGDAQVTSALTGMYAGAGNRELSRAVIQALFIRGDADALVGLARKENDPGLKRDIVGQLSMMHSKAATDYLLELLKN